HLKTTKDKKREEELMAKLVEIVNDRNAIVDGLDEDRLREEEEDEQLNKMMQNLDVKKEKKKRSSMSRLFGRKSKHEAES
ncbi:protein-methionine sulfoxide oxidase mical2b, partial [Tachysurus ichikawai]